MNNGKEFSDFFRDPYDIYSSFQLSGRLKGNDKLRSINQIRDADIALQNRDYLVFLRLIKPVISFLSTRQRCQVISRIIYNDLYLKSFEPFITTLPIGETVGRFTYGSQKSLHQELGLNLEIIKKSLANDSKKRFHSLYGFDFSRTLMAIRYSRVVGTENFNARDIDTYIQAEQMFRDTNPNFVHLDEKKGLTTILYLSDVSASNGAFRYVRGSHRAKISPILKAFHEFMLNDMKIMNYEEMMHYPPEFRAGINYYFWLEPEKRKIIDSFLKIHTGPAGSVISFAGNSLLHGGGIPYSGERSALFISHIGTLSHRVRQFFHPLSVLSRQRYGV